MFRKQVSLLKKIIYTTTNSRKQTTPKLIRNPTYTQQRTIQKKPKNYKYNLDAPHVINKHLYWNQVVDNRKVRKAYKLRRFKKLGIRPLHENGVLVVERPIQQILRELRDRKLIIKSPSRIYVNIFELYKRFGSEAKEYSDLMDAALKEIEGTVGVMTFREFAVYCTVLGRTGHAPTQSLFIHFYHHLFSAQLIKQPLRIDLFASLCRFFFDSHQKYPEELLFQKKRHFKLFEDNDPIVKGFDVLVDTLYSEQYLSELTKTEGLEKIKKLAPLFKGAPGQMQLKLNSL